MGRVNTPLLSEVDQEALKKGLHDGKTHAFRNRCQVILLKASGRTSIEVGLITNMTYVSVNAWVKRFKELGLVGLKTKSGRGRKKILNKVDDESSILEVVKANRQRLQTAKAEWEESTGKKTSLSTLKSFLKVLAVDISA